MAYILVDGYNLLGIFHKNLEKAREGIIATLGNYCDIKGHDLTIVFDGWKDGEPFESRFEHGRVTVIYSRLGEKADAVIERTLRGKEKAWIVVTSDRAVADFAWSMGYASVGSQEFERKLESSIQKKSLDVLNQIRDEEEYIKYHRKGNPRQPNKRQKLKIKALDKL